MAMCRCGGPVINGKCKGCGSTPANCKCVKGKGAQGAAGPTRMQKATGSGQGKAGPGMQQKGSMQREDRARK